MNKIMRFGSGGIEVVMDCKTSLFTIKAANHTWRQEESFSPCLLLRDGLRLCFRCADVIRHVHYKSGVGEGIVSYYEWKDAVYPGVENEKAARNETAEHSDFSLETLVWLEYASQALHFELILGKGELSFQKILWPGYFTFEKNSADAYTVMPVLQGLLIPNTWENDVKTLPFDGQFCSAGAYMPWFGQVEEGSGYIAICETPWDAGYYIDHPAGGPHTHVGIYFLPSLGTLSYRRSLRYVFLENCDYNDLCKVYRRYAIETGLLTTLSEKAARNPLVDDLIGAAVVHKGIKKHVSPDSQFYDREHPEKNDAVIPFHARSVEILRYHQMGVKKLYLHLDGWGAPGYDNQHPDYLPACPEAGGWEGLKELSDTIYDCGYLFGLHDQYRDYYLDAATYDREFALHAADGSVFEMARWAGGRQNYLCATQAPYYVKHNFEEVLAHGIRLQASYLVYHDCMILPWLMDRQPDGEDYMLYALLNGGASYLDRDGAYPDTDGKFDSEAKRKLAEEIARCAVVSCLQERVAKCEMLRHEFLDGDYDRQRTIFADGTTVTIDFKSGEYQIKEA